MDISVVICTRDRVPSLEETLRLLAAADRRGLEVEVVVVDNGTADGAADAARAFGGAFPVRTLRVAEPGKWRAMNCALDAGLAGEIVAFLDDDMSPEPGWFQGVAAITRRWRGHDIFGGRSYVIWPVPEALVPPWALRAGPFLRGYAFSVIDPGRADWELPRHIAPSGNAFWLRAGALEGHRFSDVYSPELALCFGLYDEGRRGVLAPDAATGHRIQPALLTREWVRARALRLGAHLARMRPPGAGVRWLPPRAAGLLLAARSAAQLAWARASGSFEGEADALVGWGKGREAARAKRER